MENSHSNKKQRKKTIGKNWSKNQNKTNIIKRNLIDFGLFEPKKKSYKKIVQKISNIKRSSIDDGGGDKIQMERWMVREADS